MRTAISVEKLSKFYDGTKILKNISFEVKEGEFFGFLGPNGAGKTTTISSITGLSTFQEGKIKIFNFDVVNDYREARNLVGLSQQDFNFDDFFNVEKILYHQGGYHGMAGQELKDKVDELLLDLKLNDKRKSDVRKLSGGMKRRLMLAKALIGNPRVLILDEPTTGVDVELRHELWGLLEKLNNKGITIFLTTHYIEEAEKLCDRIAIINKGKIVELDTVSNLKRKYSKDLIEIEIEKDIKNIPEVLAKYKPRQKDNSLIFECDDSAENLELILHSLRMDKIKVRKVRVSESSLENIYLELTKQ